MSKCTVGGLSRWILLIVAVWAVGALSVKPSHGVSPYLAEYTGKQTEEHDESSSSSSQMQAQQGFLVPALYERTYVSIPAAAFQPRCQDTRYGQYGYGLEVFGEGEGCEEADDMGSHWSSLNEGFVAGVQLPHSWTVTAMEIIYILDDHRRTGMHCYLYSVDTRHGSRGWGAGDLMAICYAFDDPTEIQGWWARYLTADINNAQVDNSRYTYYIEWAMNAPRIATGRLSTLPICVIIELARPIHATAP